MPTFVEEYELNMEGNDVSDTGSSKYQLEFYAHDFYDNDNEQVMDDDESWWMGYDGQSHQGY